MPISKEQLYRQFEDRQRLRRVRDLEFLKHTPREELAVWLLDDYSAGNPGLKSVDDSHLSLETQFRIVFDASDAETQRKITGALGDALSAWRLETHTGENLFHLVCAAAESGARETIPSLIWLVQSGEADKAVARDGVDEIPIVAVLSGLAPDEEVKEAFNRWATNPDFNPIYAGLIMVGRAICDPDKYPEFLRDFWKSDARIPGYFIHSALYFSLIYDNSIGVDTFVRHMDEFTPAERRKMLTDLGDEKRFVNMTEQNDHLMFYDENANVTYDCGPLS